jgi:hypothetical protein
LQNHAIMMSKQETECSDMLSRLSLFIQNDG